MQSIAQILKKFLVAILRLLANGIAELHISDGVCSFKLDLKRIQTTA